jgi:hypothetical protein
MFYGPRRFEGWPWPPGTREDKIMRAETEKLVDEIRQAIGLLRRHL